MTKDEALKLALEALENISTALREDDVLGSDSELMLNAITAINEALASNGLGLAVGLSDADFAIYQRGYDKGRVEGMRTSKKPNIPSPQLPQPEERNFCPRCGKRTADPTTIHTCTPPQENT